jgi:hypothetical protein
VFVDLDPGECRGVVGGHDAIEAHTRLRKLGAQRMPGRVVGDPADEHRSQTQPAQSPRGVERATPGVRGRPAVGLQHEINELVGSRWWCRTFPASMITPPAARRSTI